MKKLYLFCFSIAFFQVNTFSQSCLPEGITFHIQNDIDSFQVNYPGCTVIEGDVYIGDYGGGSNINNLNGLSVLTSIGGNFSIWYNESLTSLAGLENIITVGNQLGIFSNPALTNLEGLEGISYVYYLGVSSNQNLINLTGLENLASVGYGLHIYNNPSLTCLMGLDGLTSVGAGLSISSNNALLSLDGLDNLVSIGNGMSIEFNNALESIAALHNLVSIHTDDHPGTLSLKANIALTSLAGLENIEPESIEDLSIGWNTVLSTCDVNSICQYLAAPNGYIAIRYNAPGCNSQEDVEAACLEEYVEEVVSHQSSVVSYPNPVTDQVTFKIRLQDPAKVNLTVFNSLGQVIATILDDPFDIGYHQIIWNAEGLKPGMYFYRLRTGSRSFTGKIVVAR
jgi:hypothetical protein